MGDAIAAVRRALPDSSCLLVSPNDLSWKTTSGVYSSKAVVPKLAAIQRRVAAAQGCAFWDLFEAMGNAKAWQDSRPKNATPAAARAREPVGCATPSAGRHYVVVGHR